MATRRLLNPKETRIFTWELYSIIIIIKSPRLNSSFCVHPRVRRRFRMDVTGKRGTSTGNGRENEKWTQNRNLVILAPLSRSFFSVSLNTWFACLRPQDDRDVHVILAERTTS